MEIGTAGFYVFLAVINQSTEHDPEPLLSLPFLFFLTLSFSPSFLS